MSFDGLGGKTGKSEAPVAKKEEPKTPAKKMSAKELAKELPTEVPTEGALSALDFASKEEDEFELTQLPNLEIAHFYDPDTGNEIMTREDLVVVITSDTHKSCLVQHADDTHIYSQVTEIWVPQHQITQGELMMEQIIEPFPTGRNKEDLLVQGKEKEEQPNKDGSKKPNVVGEHNDIVPIEMKKGIEKKPSVGQKPIEGDYEKKHPLIGTEATFPDKPGVKASSFAEAQKKHSQTWAPEGYGEACAGKPDCVWPPQEPGTPKQRYETPPLEEDDGKSTQLPDSRVEIATWHVRKEGFAKVHGKVGNSDFSISHVYAFAKLFKNFRWFANCLQLD